MDSPKSLKETFRSLRVHFDVDRARELLSGREAFSFPVHPGLLGLVSIDQDYALQTVNEEPLFLARFDLGLETHTDFLIDGHHRVFRALSMGLQELPARMLSLAETKSIMTGDPWVLFEFLRMRQERAGALMRRQSKGAVD